jgi:cytochrome c oxidase cbb3-type subunit 3
LPRTRRIVFILLACLAPAGARLAAAAGPADEAAKIYVARCQACHGIDGKAPFPDLVLADDKWIHGGSLADITRIIEDGVPGKAMVAFKAQLTKEQIDALAKYVRALSKKGKSEKGASGK